MQELELQNAISEIRQACEGRPGSNSPFFFIVGAGISAPTIPVAAEIEAECKSIALVHKRTAEPKSKSPLDTYSHWFEAALPNAEQRQKYLRDKIEKKPISPAVFRLAHLLLTKAAGNLVITPNFDDFLSRALSLFGQVPIICDHPKTISRVSIESPDIKIIHVHGTYWFYDCCNLKAEIAQRADNPRTGEVTIPSLLEHLLWNRSPIVIGYSGWEDDVIMTALRKRLLTTLPYNIYWSCYKPSDCDLLPLWLKDHPSVRFILPRAEATGTPAISAEADEAGLVEAQAVKAGVSRFETLPARKVLDSLVKSFNLEPPPFTKNPLEFFAAQLGKSVFTDEGEQSETDIYDFKNVVARVQAAAKLLEDQDATRSEIDRALEGLRNALRQSDYREAIKIAGGISQTSATAEQLVEIMVSASTAAKNLADNSIEELEGNEIVCKAAAALTAGDKSTSASALLWARSLVNKGIVLNQLNRSEEAIATYDELLRRFGDSAEPSLRERVASALFSKGVTLNQLLRREDSVAVYDEVVRRFGDADEPALRENVAKALFNKGATLGQMQRGDDAIVVYSEVVRRFGDAAELALRDVVARALVNAGFNLGQLNRDEEAIAVYGDVLKRFGDVTEPALRESVSRALRNKGNRLAQLGRGEEAIAIYDEVVRRFGEASDAALREQVAKALVNKGVTLGRLNRSGEGMAVFEEVVRRFGDAAESALQMLAADALLSQAKTLKRANQNERAAAKCAEIVARYGGHADAGIQGFVSEARKLMGEGHGAEAAGA